MKKTHKNNKKLFKSKNIFKKIIFDTLKKWQFNKIM